ncbi:MAG: formate dehydrogenase subunit alpha [Halieaceae bacterium]|jgi:formate dehydrogenase major subunit|nr:formate dehydrogenase subunit alpha [Halieaceae bacterium]
MLEYFDPRNDIDPERDYGTAAPSTDPVPTGDLVDLVVDGAKVRVPDGTSVMRAASIAGINIPKLCATDSLEAYGSCRLCLVEIGGKAGYSASCTTLVEEGMEVSTQSDKLGRLRRNVMELYISDHPLDCLTCSANGDCELQDMAGIVGLREQRYGDGGSNHLDDMPDGSNPYFQYDPAKCIVCSRCVRACEQIQGTYALSISGRGFASRISAGQGQPFMDSDCVSCGACVQACPTATLTEKTIIATGQPDHSVITTCAYCGVGCAFKAEMKGDQVVRMVPWKGGRANRGHACIKGRFAFGYASHKDRITQPMIRQSIDLPWRNVSWDEAFEFAAGRLRSIQAEYGRDSVGGITSSRCTNEEIYLVQKMVRAAFGNNNIDNCARVCHAPTGFGLKTTLGESAGTQTFDSVEKTDVMLVIGANPTESHPVFGSRMRKRLREGTRLIVVDPRRIDLVKSPHAETAYHLKLLPGTNVALINALAHVIVDEGLEQAAFIAQRCEREAFDTWRTFIGDSRHSPEQTEQYTGVPAEDVRQAARLYATGGNAAIYYGLGVTEHSQGSTAVMGIANLAMLTGNIGREGVGVNPMRGQNNVQGACDMGSFPHELPGYRHLSGDPVRQQFEEAWGVDILPEPGYRITNMLDAAVEGSLKGMYIQGEDIAQSDPNTQHVEAALGNLECLIVQDLFLNETAKYAHVFLPGSTFLEKDGTFTNAERRISPVRKVMAPASGLQEWQVTAGLSRALGYAMDYDHPSEIMDEIAALTPAFGGVSYDRLDREGSLQWPCNEDAPDGTPIMHVEAFVRGKGFFALTEFIPTDEKVTEQFPLLLTTGRILSQYNVGAQTRRTDNVAWHSEDVLEVHAQDAQDRGIENGDLVSLSSRSGITQLHVKVSDRVQPGVVYTTFHHPETGANVITTDNSDWATNCPEYKVTAVQVGKPIGASTSEWQQKHARFSETQIALLDRQGEAQ